MCEWCRTHYGIDVTNGSIFTGGYASDSFDVVTLWDVLEHTPDPMATLREAARLLRPGGLLVVNYPDYGSAVARLMGRRWVFLLTVHYYYFTRSTIRAALERVGCSVLQIRPHIQRLELDYVLHRAAPYVGAPARLLRRMAGALRIGGTQIPYWMGQTLVVARKNAS
jgi:SAM-dependent methyltransferase